MDDQHKNIENASLQLFEVLFNLSMQSGEQLIADLDEFKVAQKCEENPIVPKVKQRNICIQNTDFDPNDVNDDCNILIDDSTKTQHDSFFIDISGNDSLVDGLLCEWADVPMNADEMSVVNIFANHEDEKDSSGTSKLGIIAC